MQAVYSHVCPWCHKVFLTKFNHQVHCSRHCASSVKHGAYNTLGEAFWGKVQKTEGCWLWTAGKTKFGYGKFRVPGSTKTELAHRVSWQMHFGEVPEGKCVLHHCDNPSCIRPDHLFLGDYADNKQDAMNKGRHSHGEKVNTAKLTEDQVREIRKACALGAHREETANRYGISRSTLQRILSFTIWSHIPPP